MLTLLICHVLKQGIPTHDAAGEPVSKGLVKKLLKEQAKQKALYEKHNQ